MFATIGNNSSISSIHISEPLRFNRRMDVPKCDYCSYSKSEGLVQCVDCERYFCNGTFYGGLQGSKASRSHVVQHASHVKHVQFLFYGPSQSGDIGWNVGKICSRSGCQQDNLFELGIEQLAGQVVCRAHAAAKNLINRHSWRPLVSSEGKAFAGIVQTLCPWDPDAAKSTAQTPWGLLPGEKWDVRFCRLLEEYVLLFAPDKQSPAHFRKWRAGILSCDPRVPVTSLKSYGYHFMQLLDSLDKLEGNLIKTLPPLHVSKILMANEAHLKALVPFGIYRDLLSTGCPVQLLNTNATVLKGHIAHITEDQFGNILDIDIKKHGVKDFGPPVSLKIDYYGIPTKRMQNAVSIFQRGPLTDPVRNLLLNRPKLPSKNRLIISNRCHEDEIEPVGLPVLNNWQFRAADKALNSHVTLIQGPPGTGKTETAAVIVVNFYEFLKKGEKILCCAPSNHATDQLLLAITRRMPEGINIVRLLARSKKYKGVPGVSQYTVRGLYNVDPMRRLPPNTFRQWESHCVEKADIVCVTCNSAAMDVLKNGNFPYVVIDECNQALEPDCLIPITKRCQQLVLVGDSKQLGPVVKYQSLERTALGISLFARLSTYPEFAQDGSGQVMLKHQYRMHSEIGKMISAISYGGQLEHKANDVERKVPRLEFISGLNDSGAHPLLFVDVWHNDELSGGGDSYLNNKEAHIVTRIVANLLAEKRPLLLGEPLRPEQLGIVTFYRGQTRALLAEMKHHPALKRDNQYEKIEINSIDGFQGREKDVIILSCVRSGGSGTFQQRAGFVDDPHRLNVSMSRAKCWLIAVGDVSVFSDKKVCTNWPRYLEHFRKSALHARETGSPRGALHSVVRLPLACADQQGSCQFCAGP